MLWTISLLSSAVWLIGVSASFTFHGYIHLFLFIGLSAAAVGLIHQRRTAAWTSGPAGEEGTCLRKTRQ